MADDNWLYFRLRFGKDEQVSRVSRWAAGQLAAGLSVATLWTDHPDEIAVAKDGTVIEHHRSDDRLQAVSFPLVFPGELD